MNDQPNDRAGGEANGSPCADTALEQRLRRYYEARRAGGPTPDDLRARVAARLAPAGARPQSSAPPSIPQEIAMLPRRSDTSTSTTTPPALRAPRRSSRTAGIAALLATAAVIALAALIFSSLRPSAPSPVGAPSHANRPSASGWTGWKPLLTAGGWGAVYLDASAHLHLVTPDGHDIAGPVLPNASLIASSPALPLANASISPDGKRLAYIQAGDPNTGGKLAILDFTTGALKLTAVTALQFAWSPDSSTIATTGQLDSGTVWVVNAASGIGHPITVQVNGAPGGLGRPLAWTDNSHLAAIVSAGAPQGDTLSGGPQNLLGVIDVTSGQTRIITTLATPPDVYVSPDGAVALIAANAWSPTARLVNLRSGVVTPLPAITAAFAGKLVNMDNADYAQGGNYSTHFAWQPGTHTLALSLRASGLGSEGTSGPATQPAGAWLLNLDADTATQITHDTFPLAWSADGSTLLLCSLPPAGAIPAAGAGVGPDLSTLSPVAASGKPHQLARDMAAFLGLAA